MADGAQLRRAGLASLPVGLSIYGNSLMQGHVSSPWNILNQADFPPSTPASRSGQPPTTIIEGSLDGDLLALFRESGAWETILSPEQEAGTK